MHHRTPADECHEFIGITEFSPLSHARGQVASQRDNMANTRVMIFLQHIADVFAGRADAGKMGRNRISLCLDFQHCLKRPVTSRSPAPNVTEKNFGLSCANCLRVARNFSIPSGVCGGKNSKLKVGANFFCDSIFAKPGGKGEVRTVRATPYLGISAAPMRLEVLYLKISTDTFRLIRSVFIQIQIFRLLVGQFGEFDAQLS